MAWDRSNRYASANELATDLQNWISGANNRQKAHCLLQFLRKKEVLSEPFVQARNHRQNAINILEKTDNAEEGMAWKSIEKATLFLNKVRDFHLNKFSPQACFYAPTMNEFHIQLMRN